MNKDIETGTIQLQAYYIHIHAIMSCCWVPYCLPVS